MSTLDLSIVVPFFNERDNAAPLYEELTTALTALGRSYELVFIDDGSTDGTAEALDQLAERDARVVAIHLSRNFGQTAALTCGFDRANGQAIVTLDGDQQNDPRDIPHLLQELRGADLVCGWRFPRRDPWLTRRLPSRLANWLIRAITGVRVHDYGCTLKAFRAELIPHLRLYGSLHRFIPAIASWAGARIAEVQVHHRPRSSGRSKYGLGRTLQVVLDLITVKFLSDFSTNPIQIFGLWGLGGVLVGSGICGYLSALKLFTGASIGTRPLLLLGVLLILVGVQLIVMGLLAELLVRIYHEGQRKPIYVIREPLASRPVPSLVDLGRGPGGAG